MCYFRMRDRSRVEAIGKSIAVSSEVIVIEELKWIFLDETSLQRGIELVCWKKKRKRLSRLSPKID